MTEKLLPERQAQIAENIRKIREGMNAACINSGRNLQEVTLLAATKTVSAAEINYATQLCGITDIGENRVQELLDKYDALDRTNVRLHFIGQLQCNKVKYIIDKVDLIHSVDSVKLAREIDRQARRVGRVMPVLIEVNIGREENKGGVMPEQVMPLADEISALPGLKLSGIMTIAPVCEKNDAYCKFFKETYRIFLDICEKKIHNRDRSILSMGMSGNYESAIACGSNMIRLGTAVFGSRTAPQTKDYIK